MDKSRLKIKKGIPQMDKSARDNRIFANFSPRAATVILFALAALLGALSCVLAEVPAFAGISVFLLAATVFMLARDVLPLCGILLPCFFELMMTGNLTLPAIYLGFTFCIGAVAYLAIGKKIAAAVIVALLSYTAAAVVRDPITAIIVLIPVALGLLAALMLPRLPLSETVSSMTILLLSGGVIAFLAMGGDLSATAESLRASILELYRQMNDKIFIIEESSAEILAAYFINILPGVIFAAVSAVCFVSCALTVSLLRTSGLGGDIPDNMQKLTLSPISGSIFIICFFLSAAFSIEGGELEIVSAVADNVLIALVFPFLVVGCTAAKDHLSNRVFSASLRRGNISFAAIALLFIISPSIAVVVFTCFGILDSFRPIIDSAIKKIRSYGKKQ